MSNVEGERTMADLADEFALVMDRRREQRLKAQELRQELIAARTVNAAVAKLIPAVLFLLDRCAED